MAWIVDNGGWADELWSQSDNLQAPTGVGLGPITASTYSGFGFRVDLVERRRFCSVAGWLIGGFPASF